MFKSYVSLAAFLIVLNSCTHEAKSGDNNYQAGAHDATTSSSAAGGRGIAQDTRTSDAKIFLRNIRSTETDHPVRSYLLISDSHFPPGYSILVSMQADWTGFQLTGAGKFEFVEAVLVKVSTDPGSPQIVEASDSSEYSFQFRYNHPDSEDLVLKDDWRSKPQKNYFGWDSTYFLLNETEKGSTKYTVLQKADLESRGNRFGKRTVVDVSNEADALNILSQSYRKETLEFIKRVRRLFMEHYFKS